MTQPVSSVTAVLPKDTVYTVNDSDVKVVDGRPSLLVDEIVSTDNSASGSDYRGVLLVLLMMVKPQGLLGDINFKYIRQRMEHREKSKEAANE